MLSWVQTTIVAGSSSLMRTPSQSRFFARPFGHYAKSPVFRASASESRDCRTGRDAVYEVDTRFSGERLCRRSARPFRWPAGFATGLVLRAGSRGDGVDRPNGGARPVIRLSWRGLRLIGWRASSTASTISGARKAKGRVRLTSPTSRSFWRASSRMDATRPRARSSIQRWASANGVTCPY
jgi:hypothetical protein